MSNDTNTDYQAWLDSLKPGDQVAYRSVSIWRSGKVKSRTKTGRITLETGLIFNSNGSVPTSDSYCCVERLTRPTQAIMDSIEHRNLATRMHNVGWAQMTLGQLQRIAAIVKKQNPS